MLAPAVSKSIPWVLVASFVALQAIWIASNISPDRDHSSLVPYSIEPATSSDAESDLRHGSYLVLLHPQSTIQSHTTDRPMVITVESGTLWTEMLTGSARIMRSIVPGEFLHPEMLRAGISVSLEAGDVIAYDTGSVRTLVNPSESTVPIVITMPIDSASLFQFV